MKNIFVLLLFAFLVSCIPPLSREYGDIKGATEITLELNDGGKRQSLQDTMLISRFLDEVNHAEEAGPMKGNGWHKIIIWKGDAIWELYTDGKVFGRKPSGKFYKFKSENILKEYWNIDTH